MISACAESKTFDRLDCKFSELPIVENLQTSRSKDLLSAQAEIIYQT
jgi:hypothetical protein